jgi:hypothetical protein
MSRIRILFVSRGDFAHRMQLTFALFSLAITVAVTCGCAPARKTVEPPLVTVSHLILNSQSYDGASVRVRGYLVLRSSARHLWSDPSMIERGLSESECITLLNTDRHFTGTANLRQYATITGVFRTNVLGSGIVDLGACNRSGIDITSVDLK